MADTVSNKYCIFVGTSRGVLQYTTCKPDEKIKFETSSEPTDITALEWGKSQDEILVGYKAGNFAIYNAIQNKFARTSIETEGSGAVIGLSSFDKCVIVGKRDGIINVWTPKHNEYFSLNLNENATLDCVRLNTNRHGIVGTGGESNDFKLWNVETHQCIFKAKSLGHDELNLPIPTSVRSITFFPEDEHLSCCATKEGHVLLYDDRAQRRPVVKFLEPKASYTTITCAYRQRQCLVGTTKGYMQLLDMKAGKCLKTFKSYTGSVTSIACDSVEPYVASTSLDRFLRIHNLETKELVYKCYMKQNLTKVLMKPIVKEENEEQPKTETTLDEEYEELFKNMETISETDNSVSKTDNQRPKVKRKKVDSNIVINPIKKKKKKVNK